MTEPDWDDWHEDLPPRRKVVDVQGIRVMKKMCSTCIFKPGNLMQLRAGRVQEMVQECLDEQDSITCHSTLEEPEQAICKGFFDRYADDIWQLRWAKNIGYIKDHVISEDERKPSDEDDETDPRVHD